jgi:hypothetical protein
MKIELLLFSLNSPPCPGLYHNEINCKELIIDDIQKFHYDSLHLDGAIS